MITNIINIFRAFNKKSKHLTSVIFLHAAYFIGIGITAVCGKLIGKHFLPVVTKNTSSWVRHVSDSEFERMY